MIKGRLVRVALVAMRVLVGSVALAACSGAGDQSSDVTAPGGGAGGGSATGLGPGIWERRTNDGSGDETDLAIGTIPGEGPDRVWLCEVRPRRPETLLLRGRLRGSTITWDPVHVGVPSYNIGRDGDRRWLQVASPGALRTFYDPGPWSRFCPPQGDTRIYVLFTAFGDGPTVTFSSVSSNMGCAAGVGPNTRVGPCAAGRFQYSVTTSTGQSFSNISVDLEAPTDTTMRRIYRVGLSWIAPLGRYVVGHEFEDVSNSGGTAAVHAGDNQTVLINTVVPVAPAVIVRTPAGRPVAGATVRFRVVEGEGTLTDAVQLTDAQGIARVGSWRVGRAAGRHQVVATVLDMTGAPVSFVATARLEELQQAATMERGACAVGEFGGLWCWGQLGWVGRSQASVTTTPVRAEGAQRWRSLSAGYNHACGLTTTDRVYCFGNNEMGQAGRPTTASLLFAPDSVLTALTFMQVVAGGFHSCALTAQGAAYCWGRNAFGQLGTGTTTSSHVPQLVTGGHVFSSLTAGQMHTCGVRRDGVALCWGANRWEGVGTTSGGQLGDGTTTNRLVPTVVQGGHQFTHLAAGMTHTCGRLTTGVIRCWGENQYRQLGITTAALFVMTPTVVTNATGLVDLQAGANATCGRTSTGTLLCWGLLEGAATYNTPTPIATPFRNLSLSAAYGCGKVETDGRIHCWGSRLSPLGDGVARTEPKLVPGPISDERPAEAVMR